eukprot:GHVO01020262.1.p1 GENE.GHVO01020262.1~~GHVO01020262.1.p1  ORF type:complete len:104 (+),score=5.38 GHVO01020262.1:1-312(+)
MACHWLIRYGCHPWKEMRSGRKVVMGRYQGMKVEDFALLHLAMARHWLIRHGCHRWKEMRSGRKVMGRYRGMKAEDCFATSGHGLSLADTIRMPSLEGNALWS